MLSLEKELFLNVQYRYFYINLSTLLTIRYDQKLYIRFRVKYC